MRMLYLVKLWRISSLNTLIDVNQSCKIKICNFHPEFNKIANSKSFVEIFIVVRIIYQPATEASAVGASMKEMPPNQLSDTEKENLEQIPRSEGRYTAIHFFQEASIMLDL